MPNADDYKHDPPKELPPVGTLSEEEAKEEIEALREAIEYHNYRYYIKNQPVISDRRYDRLFERLKELEAAFEQFDSPTSPTKSVGAPPVDEHKQVEHTAPMISLNAALEDADVRDWIDFVARRLDDRPRFVVEPKFDGLSVEVVYEDGAFLYGATRGDGRTGEDISENLKTVGSIMMRLQDDEDHPLPATLALRGEVYMTKDGFQDMNRRRIERGEEPFANPRNAAAGAVRQLDPKKVAERPLDIFFYEILAMETAKDAPDEEEPFATHWEMLQQLPRWGLKSYENNRRCSTFEELRQYWSKFIEEREALNFEIDGMVIKCDRLADRKRLGSRERSPRWALAWKFPPKREVTTLEDIVVQVGRTGMLTPVALLAPVDVGGVTVSRATLHNEDEVHRKDVRPGDRVRIERAGDVIPEVVRRVETEEPAERGERFEMPKSCPSCGSTIYREGAYYFCPAGPACPAQLVGHILQYGSRDALDIEGLGEKTAEQLVRREMVGDIADLYDLSVEDLRSLEGFAEGSATKLHNAIHSRRSVNMDRFLYGLGIRHVGRHIARILALHFETLDALLNASQDDLEAIDGVGAEIANSIVQFFDEPHNNEVLDRLLDAGVEPEPLERPAEGDGEGGRALEKKTVVFTGELENFTRTEAQEAVELRGGRATTSVSGNTDYVVAGARAGKKLDNAREKGVMILDEEAFEELLEK